MTQEEAGRPTQERPASELTDTIVEARADEVNAPAPRSGDENRTWKTWHFSPYELFVLGAPLHQVLSTPSNEPPSIAEGGGS